MGSDRKQGGNVDTEPIETIDDDPVEDLETVDEDLETVEEPTRPDSGQPPFFRNWVWWCSLIAAVPAGFLVYELFQGAVGLSESLNLMWTATMVVTLGCAATAITLPVLLALGKMQGGLLIEGMPPVVTQAPATAESSVISSPQISDIDYGPDDSDDLGELFDSTDEAVGLDDDSEEDLDDFDDF